MKCEVYPLAMPIDLYEEVRTASKDTGLSMADVMRQGLKLGVPLLCQQLSAGRVTNVNPLPKAVLDKLYRPREDDEEGIRKFMSAQSKAVQE